MKDRKMRKKIDKTIEIVNEHQEIANLIIKGNPFHKHSHHKDSGGLGSRDDGPDLSKISSSGGSATMPEKIKEASSRKEDQSSSSEFSDSRSDSS
jgi:hypothetical protein